VCLVRVSAVLCTIEQPQLWWLEVSIRLLDGVVGGALRGMSAVLSSTKPAAAIAIHFVDTQPQHAAAGKPCIFNRSICWDLNTQLVFLTKLVHWQMLQEELREGSGAFVVHAYLPVEASFGLADEMRRRSSGAASASLLLSHWERLQVGAACSALCFACQGMKACQILWVWCLLQEVAAHYIT